MSLGWIFTNLTFCYGAVAGVGSPFIGLMVFYMFAIIRPSYLWHWVSFPTDRYSFYLALSLLAGWILSGFGNWSHIRSFWVKVSIWGLIIYLLSGAMGAEFFSVNKQYAWDAWILQFKILIIILITVSIVREGNQVQIFAWVITATLGYLAWDFNLQYLETGWNRIYRRGFGSIDNNGAAMIMVMGVPLSFFMGINDKRFWVKGLCFLAALLLIHLVLLSYSRGAMLGLCMVGIATFVVLLLHLPNKGLTIAAGIGFVFISLFLAGEQVRGEFNSIFVGSNNLDASAASRFSTWGSAWNCMLDHPMGVGPRNFNLISWQYGLGNNKSVHNLFLQTGADYGFIGMVGLMMFYLGALFATYFMSHTPSAKHLRWPQYYGHMVSIALGGFIICNMFIGMESVEIGYIISVLGLSTVIYVDRMAETDPAFQPDQIIELDEVPPPGEYDGPIPAYLPFMAS